MTYKTLSAQICTLVLFATTASASIIGNWSGSSRSLNHSDMSTANAALTGAGHTVLADGAITAAALSGMNLFWAGEATGSPTAGEITDLSGWVTGGGILLVLFDSGCSGCTGGNAILSGIGSSMVAGGSASGGVLAGGNFATTGGPYNIVGQSLVTSPGTAITGGTALAGSFLGYQQIGTGHVFAFADRSDHNFFVPNSSTVNGQLLLNIAAGSGLPNQVPEPATYALIGVGLAGLLCARRRSS